MSLRVEAGFEHLREAMAEVLSRDVEFPVGTFVTVLSAKVTANTGHAKFVLSVFPEGMKDAVLETLRDREGDIKNGLATRAACAASPASTTDSTIPKLKPKASNAPSSNSNKKANSNGKRKKTVTQHGQPSFMFLCPR